MAERSVDAQRASAPVPRDTAQLYAQLADAGLQYGPAFRLLRNVHVPIVGDDGGAGGGGDATAAAAAGGAAASCSAWCRTSRVRKPRAALCVPVGAREKR
jgi:hypothetical protein